MNYNYYYYYYVGIQANIIVKFMFLADIVAEERVDLPTQGS